MGINGYSNEELVDGPQNGWMGYYSLSQQGIEIDDFEAYIDANSPVTFTDPTVSFILKQSYLLFLIRFLIQRILVNLLYIVF